jgi:hypothetical protein
MRVVFHYIAAWAAAFGKEARDAVLHLQWRISAYALETKGIAGDDIESC